MSKDFTDKLILATVPSVITIVAQNMIQRKPQTLKSEKDLTTRLLSPKVFEYVWPIMLIILGVIAGSLQKNNPADPWLLANIVSNIAFVVFAELGNKRLSQLSLLTMVITLIVFILMNKQRNLNWYLIPYILFVFVLVIIMTILDKLKTFVDKTFGENSAISKLINILEKLKN